ncbi:hypothetical protein V5799_007075 [Amblyomma americanum]|uniref:Uncharacterized protein n=1 Tax=Amblyomma americanum TaxID=6943 RepID=A0AAQ4DUK1_AMBAM
MDNFEGLGDQVLSPGTRLPLKDLAGRPEPPPPRNAWAFYGSGDSQPDRSHSVLQATASSLMAVLKDGGCDRHLAANGIKEMSEKLVEGKISCVREHTYANNSIVPPIRDGGNGWLKRRLVGEFPDGGAASAMKQSDPSAAHQSSEAAPAVRHVGLQVDEISDAFSLKQTVDNGALGVTSHFENGVLNTAPSARQKLHVGCDNTPKSRITNNDEATVPLHSSRAPTDGGTLTSAGVPAGSSSSSSHEQAVVEEAVLSDKLVRIDSRTQARVQELLCTNHKQTVEVRQHNCTVCPMHTRGWLKAVKLRRQRDQAHERA